MLFAAAYFSISDKTTSETSFDRKVWNQKYFRKARQGILNAKHSVDPAGQQRVHVASDTGVSSSHRTNRGCNICSHSYPPHSGFAVADGNGHSDLIRVQHVTEIHARTNTQTVITPSSGIHVQ